MSFGPKFRMGEPPFIPEPPANDGLYDQREKDALAGREAVKEILKIQEAPPYIPVSRARNKLTFL